MDDVLLEFYKNDTWYGVSQSKDTATYRAEAVAYLARTPERYYYINSKMRIRYLHGG